MKTWTKIIGILANPITLALCLASILVMYDIFLFYPLRNQIGLETHTPVTFKPPITQEQFDGLTWLKTQTTSTDIVIVHRQLWSYATYLLRATHLTSYGESAPHLGEPARSCWEQAHNLVFGSPEAFRFFQDNWERALVVLAKKYDGQTDVAIDQLRDDWRFELMFENNGLVIFATYLDLALESIASLEIIDGWHTEHEHDHFELEHNNELNMSVLVWDIDGSIAGWRAIDFLPPDSLDLSNYTNVVLAIHTSERGNIMEFRLSSNESWANGIGWRFNIDFIRWHFIKLDFDSPTEDLVTGTFDPTNIRLVKLGFTLKSPQSSNITLHIAMMVA